MTVRLPSPPATDPSADLIRVDARARGDVADQRPHLRVLEQRAGGGGRGLLQIGQRDHAVAVRHHQHERDA